jgi:hypothetical protein
LPGADAAGSPDGLERPPGNPSSRELNPFKVLMDGK